MRQDLVQLLARGELNVSEITDRGTLSRPTVSHRLKVLRRAGLVRVRKQGREMYYRLNKEPIVATLLVREGLRAERCAGYPYLATCIGMITWM